jgi:hypothetical protein
MKGVKSLQLRLNELVPRLGLGVITVSNMAYCKARHKLKHTAFIELNQIGVVEVMYEDGDYETYHGFRLLGVDGSKVQLPDTDECKEVFGTMPYRSPAGRHTGGRKKKRGEHCFALASVVYDVCNRIALDARLEPVKTHETTIAAAQLASISLSAKDLVIEDRGYHSYRMMAVIARTGAHFLIRCKRKSGMPTADDMLAGNGADDQTVTIVLPKHLAGREAYRSLPASLKVRFVRVVLDNGEIEVLATSVLDYDQLTPEDCKELYYLRWGIETFYGILKTRLAVENFSGYSPEAIRQDYFATVFLTGVESIFTQDAEATLQKQKGGHPKKVNKAVSFNAIKNKAFELFYSQEPQEQVLAELEALFSTSPTLIRKDRNPQRRRHPDNKVLAWYKRQRKIVF